MCVCNFWRMFHPIFMYIVSSVGTDFIYLICKDCKLWYESTRPSLVHSILGIIFHQLVWLSFLYDFLNIPILIFPRPLFTRIFPCHNSSLKALWDNASVRMCRTHDVFLFLRIFMRILSSHILFQYSLISYFSVHFILCVLLNNHISKRFKYFSSFPWWFRFKPIYLHTLCKTFS